MHKLMDWLLVALAAFCLLLLLAGVGLLGFQVYGWLRGGTWTSLSVLAILAKYFPGSSLMQWLGAPDTGQGLQKFARTFFGCCPLSLILMVSGPVFFAVLVNLYLKLCFDTDERNLKRG